MVESSDDITLAALVFLDSVVASLMVKLGRKEEELRARHANI